MPGLDIAIAGSKIGRFTQPTLSMPPAHDPPLVLFVAFPGMGLLDLTGPQTVFWCAAKRMAGRGLAPYERHTVSVHGGLVQTAEGVALDTAPAARFAGRAIDTILVPGAPGIQAALAASGATVDWIAGAAPLARRVTSVCTGAFLLAQAGLLDGRRVATHWNMADVLEQRYPSLDVDRDAIFVRQDPVWTSAGVTAGIDLALALVEDDCGRTVAMEIARELVVFMKRPGGQAQHSELLRAQSRDGAAFDALHGWILDNLHDSGITVERLAERSRMSARNFARVYKDRTGRSPGKAVELFRVEAARRMLEQSASNLAQIARQCGFGDEDRMCTAFQRNLGVTPSAYRKQRAGA
jgi:transcriptional regulator GlxA family with amidase domain